jgi:acetyltransferase
VSRAAPTGIHENWTLPDGTAATLRPIRSADMELERAFVRNLSPQSKFKRFMGELKELSPDQLYDFTHPDHEHEAAYVVVRSTVAGEEEIGVGRFAAGRDSDTCEFAITIADAWQGKGLGKRLINALVRDAKARGLKRIEGYVLAANARMIDFCRGLGFAIEASRDDATVRVVHRDL